MKFKLSYKIFCAFFLILAIVAGAFVFSRYWFSHQFRNYIHQEELERLSLMIPLLQESFRKNGSWREIKENQNLYWQVPVEMGNGRISAGGPGMNMALPGGRFSFALSNNRPPPPHRVPGFFLLDHQHDLILAEPEAPGPYDQEEVQAIQVNGRTVGWLGMQKQKRLDSGPAGMFMQRHGNQLYLLGGIVIGLTALIAVLFSRHLLKPVKALTEGTQELAGRNFKVRLTVATSDELGMLADHFNTLAETFEAYENLRRQWLTDISHELRTPMTVLCGEIEALTDGVREPTPQNLASLKSEILIMVKLINDLHLLSVADSDNLHLDKQLISPRDVLACTVAGYMARFTQRQIGVELSLSPVRGIRIRGDAGRLNQVFTSILENAYKYVSAPGVLVITDRKEDGNWVLSFNDSGPGVPEQALPRLFDRLFRVDSSRNRDHGGSGIGLSICRRIVELHNGTIWTEQSPMGGLLIGLKIPLA